MSDDLRQRLDQLATELTQGASVPPPTAIQRRAHHHRRRQLAVGTMLLVALAGVWAGPGTDLLDRPRPKGLSSGPPTTLVAPAPKLPKVTEGEFAAVIQDPPPGFPQRIRGRITACGKIDMPTFAYPQMVIGEARYQSQWAVFNVLPFPAVKQPPVQIRVPSVSLSRTPLDGNGGEGQPFLSAERPQTRLNLDRADARRGSIVGAYRVIRYVHSGSTTAIQTIRELTGAQLAMAWDCGRFGR
jgi:hypothetical protein